jgi:hypothetical protein
MTIDPAPPERFEPTTDLTTLVVPLPARVLELRFGASVLGEGWPDVWAESSRFEALVENELFGGAQRNPLLHLVGRRRAGVCVQRTRRI